VPILVCAKS